MNWIKENYEKFLLALAGFVLLAVSGWLIFNALTFPSLFEDVRREVPPNNKIPPLDTSAIDAAKAEVEKPGSWNANPKERGSLFVSRKYIIKDDTLYDPQEKGAPPIHDKVTNPWNGGTAAIPNDWFFDNNLDPLNDNVLNEDPDGDGFTNADEWIGMDPDHPGTKPTNPQDKNSHPPYWTKLRLTRWTRVPFRLIFKGYNGDIKKPETLEFAVNTLDVRQASQLELKVGDQIKGTKFKIKSFTPKTVVDANGIEKDLSELQIEDIETGKPLTLIFNTIIDSPDSYGTFKFLLSGPEFTVKLEKTFALPPEPNNFFKLIDITQTQATIENVKTHEQIKVPAMQTAAPRRSP
jgi:hypothetical protein